MVFRFGDCTLDPLRRELLRHGHVVRVEPKVLDLLIYLIRNESRVVGKDELVTQIWNDRVISDSALTSCINGARRAIGDAGEAQRFIKTFPRRGFRFVGLDAEEGTKMEGEFPSVSSAGATEMASLVVLPFANLSGDPQQDYFVDGIAEDITMSLARMRGFLVVARSSAFAYKDRLIEVEQIGQELGVRYVLKGSVRRDQERVRLSVRLASARTGREIWADRYDSSLVDVFALQDALVASVAGAIEPQLYAAERDRVRQKPPGSLDAWDWLIRGLAHMWLHTRPEYQRALVCLQTAIERDPEYGRALGVHAWLSLWNAHQGWDPLGMVAALPPAAQQARKAVTIDGEDPWIRLALGFVRMFRREHEEAIEELEAALAINPSFALGHACLGLALAYGGKGRQAIQQFERETRLNPRDPFFHLFSGARAFAYYMAEDYERGLEWGRRGVRQAPEISGHWRALALSAAKLELHEEARAAIAKACELQPEYSVAWVEKSSPLVHASDRDRYSRLLVRFGLPPGPRTV